MSKYKNELIGRFSAKTATVGILGLGYVGLPISRIYILAGYKVLGFDIDALKIERLKNGETYIRYIEAGLFKNAYDEGRFLPTTDYSHAAGADVMILCVPTPLNKNREPELKYIVNSMEAILPYLRKGQAVVLESTTYPGTTEEVLKPMLESRGFTLGEDFFLVYSPEREDPGNIDYTNQAIPKVVSGHTKNCLDVAMAIYADVIQKLVPVSSTRTAEMVKILENTFRAVNIALVNEMKQVADHMDIDIFEVIRAASTKPFGFMPFYPGPGLGGHCIPIDPFYLTWKAREYGINTRFIELAGEVNIAMPDYVTGKISEALNTHEKHIKNARILLLGIAYKKNVDDVRESPAMALLEKLLKMGADVYYADPFVPVIPKMRRGTFNLSHTDLSRDVLSSMDCVVVVTDHDSFDWELVKTSSKLIIDTRGRFNPDKHAIFRA